MSTPDQQQLCENCGAVLTPIPVGPAPSVPGESEPLVAQSTSKWSSDAAGRHEITWTNRSSILGWNIATRQLAIVLVLSLVMMQVIVLIMGWVVQGEVVILPWQIYAMVGGVLVVLMLLAILILGNRVDMEVTVNEQGLGYVMGTRARTISRVAIVTGALAGSARVAGAGLLAASRESGFFPWKHVPRVRIDHRRRGIVLYGPVLPLIEVFCTPEAFNDVVTLVERHVKQVGHLR